MEWGRPSLRLLLSFNITPHPSLYRGRLHLFKCTRHCFLEEGQPEHSSHGRQLLRLVAFLMVIAGSPAAQCPTPTEPSVSDHVGASPVRWPNETAAKLLYTVYTKHTHLAVHFETPSQCHDKFRLVLCIRNQRTRLLFTMYKGSLVYTL